MHTTDFNGFADVGISYSEREEEKGRRRERRKEQNYLLLHGICGWAEASQLWGEGGGEDWKWWLRSTIATS